MFVNLVEKYGVVPKSVMPEAESSTAGDPSLASSPGHFVFGLILGMSMWANFVDSDFALLNARLAKHYGVVGV